MAHKHNNLSPKTRKQRLAELDRDWAYLDLYQDKLGDTGGIDIEKVVDYVRWSESRLRKVHDWAFKNHWKSTYVSYSWTKYKLISVPWFWVMWKIKSICAPKFYPLQLTPEERIRVGMLQGFKRRHVQK